MHYQVISSLLIMAFITVFTVQNKSILSENDEVGNTLAIHSNTEDVAAVTDTQVGEYIFKIFEDSKGNLWIGTRDNGVARYDGKDLVYFDEEDGLSGKSVMDIVEDKYGNLWFGSSSNMCIYNAEGAINGEAFTTFPSKDSVPLLGWGWKNVKTDNKGDIWVNTHHGIFQYTNDSFIEFEAPVISAETNAFCNTPGRISMDLVDSKGNLWFGTDGEGAYMYDGKSYTQYTEKDGLASDNITSISEDQQGNIWFSSRHTFDPIGDNGGMSRYDGNAFTNFPEIEGLYGSNVFTSYVDKTGNVWIGATGVGVYRYDGNDFKLFKEPSRVHVKASAYAPGLQTVLEDSKGQLWFGFAGGLFRFNGKDFVNVTRDGPWI